MERGEPGASKPFLCFVMERDYMSWRELEQQLEVLKRTLSVGINPSWRLSMIQISIFLS